MNKESILSIPQDMEAEQAVLGSIICDNVVLDDIIDVLNPTSFHSEPHQHVYRAMIELTEIDQPIDEITLGDQLKTFGLLEKIGGYPYLAELIECSPSTGNIVYYAKIIQEHALLRDIISTTSDIGRKSRDPEQSVSDILSEASEKIEKISEQIKDKDTKPIKDVLMSSFKKLEDISDNPDEMLGLQTGYIELDLITLGLVPSDLIVIAGRPSMGKTALALNIVSYLATRSKSKGAHLIVSIEMSEEQIGFRLLCSEARINSKKMRSGNLDQEDWDRLAMATESLSITNLHINDKAETVRHITSAVRKLAKSKNGIASLTVDYIQIMVAPRRINVREQMIAYFSKSLKNIAKRFDIPVIALAQLNRDLEKRSDKHPQLSDLRESGSIEQDADIILFIYRDEVYYNDSQDKGIAEIEIAKHRNGPTGVCRLAFIGKYTKFANLSRREP